MSAQQHGVVFLVSLIAVVAAVPKTDTRLDGCLVQKAPRSVIATNVCLQTQHHTFTEHRLVCPDDRVVVLKSIALAVKNATKSCLKRVQDNEFCCMSSSVDILYDGHCLQGLWNPEDVDHYRNVLGNILNTCMGRSACTFRASLFQRLQRQLPTLDVYSSYFQVIYHCVEVPKHPVQLCTSASESVREFHIQAKGGNRSCSCTVTSDSPGNVVVSAVDVRSLDVHGEPSTLSLKTLKSTKNLTDDNLPVFGFREILTARRVNITLNNRETGSWNANLMIWLHVKAEDGSKVNFTCAELSLPVTMETSTPGDVAAITEYRDQLYWPIVLAACCAVIILCLLFVIILTVYLCKRRREKRKRRQFRSIPSISTTKDYADIYDPPYATVHDRRPPGTIVRVCRSQSSQTLQRPYSKVSTLRPSKRSMSMRSLRDRPPMAPPPPPPPNPRTSSNRGYNHLDRGSGLTQSDVEQLQVFLEGREGRPSRLGSIQGSLEGSGYDSPSNISSRSHFRGHQASFMEPTFEGSSSPCFSSVFESEECATEALLARAETHVPPSDLLGEVSTPEHMAPGDFMGEGVGTPTHMDPSDFLGEHIVTLLSDYSKEDMNHNRFDTLVQEEAN